MRIGIVSDTHGFFDPSISDHFDDCDEVWHLGDIGSIEIVDQLNSLSQTTRVIYGNIDSKEIQLLTHEFISFNIEDLNVLLIHIAGRIEKYNKQVRELINSEKPDLLVCGHSHILKVAKDKRYNLLHINPGAAGNQGFHKMRTILKMEIANGKVENMVAIELGKRGKINQ